MGGALIMRSFGSMNENFVTTFRNGAGTELCSAMSPAEGAHS